MSVHLAATGLLFQKTLGPGETTWLPAMQHDRYRYLPLPLGGCRDVVGCKIWELTAYAAGFQWWWQLSAILVAVRQQKGGKVLAKALSNMWPTFSGHVAKVCPISLGICKAIDRSGRTKHWQIVLPEATASTSGLLMILIGQATGARPTGDRAIYMKLLQELLKDTLGKECLTISLVLDPALLEGCLLGPHTALGGKPVHVDFCNVWLRTMTEACTLAAKHNMLVLTQALKAVTTPKGTTPLHLLMTEAHTLGMDWLVGQLVFQAAVAIEESIAERSVENPVDGSSGMYAGRFDADLATHLAMGKGSSFSSQAVACMPSQHVASFCAIKKPLKGTSLKLSFLKTSQQILVRYLDMAQQAFKDCSHIAVAGDGTRVGGVELMQWVIFGLTKDGEEIAAWAPPQVFGHIHEHIYRACACL